MKIYKIRFADKYGEYSGSIKEIFDNVEAAEKAKDWHESHPMPDDPGILHFWIETINMDDVLSGFVPPMTEDSYNQLISDYYPDQDYPEDYEDEYPEPSEEELERYRETEALANELQEQEARLKEERQQTLDAIVDEAIDLCKEILNK